MSTKVSVDGPKGVKIAHPAAPTAATAIRNSTRRNPAAPSPFFRFPRLRLDAIYARTPFPRDKMCR